MLVGGKKEEEEEEEEEEKVKSRCNFLKPKESNADSTPISQMPVKLPSSQKKGILKKET